MQEDLIENEFQDGQICKEERDSRLKEYNDAHKKDLKLTNI